MNANSLWEHGTWFIIIGIDANFSWVNGNSRLSLTVSIINQFKLRRESFSSINNFLWDNSKSNFPLQILIPVLFGDLTQEWIHSALRKVFSSGHVTNRNKHACTSCHFWISLLDGHVVLVSHIILLSSRRALSPRGRILAAVLCLCGDDGLVRKVPMVPSVTKRGRTSCTSIARFNVALILRGHSLDPGCKDVPLISYITLLILSAALAVASGVRSAHFRTQFSLWELNESLLIICITSFTWITVKKHLYETTWMGWTTCTSSYSDLPQILYNKQNEYK